MSAGSTVKLLALDVTRPARSSVALERLVQKELAALGDHLREIGRSRGRGRGIEPERRGRVDRRSGPDGAGDASKSVLGPVSTNPSTGLSPDLTTNARSGKKLVKAAGPRDTESAVPSRCHGVGADLHQDIPELARAWCDRGLAGCRSTTGRTCRQAEAIRTVDVTVPVARSTLTRPPAFTASLLTPRRLESDRITTFAGAPPAANRSKALTSATGSAIPGVRRIATGSADGNEAEPGKHHNTNRPGPRCSGFHDHLRPDGTLEPSIPMQTSRRRVPLLVISAAPPARGAQAYRVLSRRCADLADDPPSDGTPKSGEGVPEKSKISRRGMPRLEDNPTLNFRCVTYR